MKPQNWHRRGKNHSQSGWCGQSKRQTDTHRHTTCNGLFRPASCILSLILTFGLGRPALAQAAEEKPKITEVYPPVAYPSKGTTRYDLTIFGENFGESQTNLSIELSGIGALSMEWVANA